MDYFLSTKGGIIVDKIIKAIQENRDYLSEIDGLIGDGDHGINMNKGFSLCEKYLKDEKDIPLAKALKTLGRTLLLEIGGSMGPLYGTFFIEMSKECDVENIDAEVFARMMESSVASLMNVGKAKPGDKTLLDTVVPAQLAYKKAISEGKDFISALNDMKEAAEKGKESTRDLVAKVGRASRLGERSRGVLDAGATSCNLILQAMADSMITCLNEK